MDEGDGAAVAQRFFADYQIPNMDRYTPLLFYANGYLAGDSVIEHNLVRLVQNGSCLGFEERGSAPSVHLSFPVIFAAGLVGGVNPCSISMILLLLSLIASKRGQVVKMGVTYIASKVFAYLLLGLALYSFLDLLNTNAFQSVENLAKWLAAALAIGLCAFNIADCVNARRENYGKIRVQLPARLRKFNNNLITTAVNSGARFMLPLIFALGVVVSAGEFLCTGQIYLAAILYIRRAGDITAIPAFLTYVLAMIIPMSLILLVAAQGKRLLEMSETARKNMPAIKAANALLFLAFAVFIIIR
jgi:cytochrome c biogenesis protein CcdA